ncbi:MAG: hypothetical protein R3F43_18810 [bacterium]
MPRNVDPAVDGLDNVFVYDVDDLQAIADTNLEQRRREAEAAEALVATEAHRFVRDLAGQAVTPVIQAMRRKAEAIKVGELERAAARLAGLDAAQQKAVERLADGLVNKLLHDAMVGLKQSAAAGTPRSSRRPASSSA